MALQNRPRYGLDPYLDWVKKEGIPVSEGIALDLFQVPTGDWPRYGVKGAIAHFSGSGDFLNMFVLEIQPGGSTSLQQHLYEEIYYVLDGHGSTQLEFEDGSKRSFEWGPRSFFAIPLNAKQRFFNGSGSKRALLATTTNLPLMIKLFNNEDFIFSNPFDFPNRTGKEEYYAGDGDLYMIRPGNNIWETNFIPDLGVIPLTPYEERGAGSSQINFILADGVMHAHMSEIAPATYKKAHRHDAGFHVLMVSGTGYSLLWSEGDGDFTRIDWRHGVVFPPTENQFHQHFVTSNEAARYVATGLGSVRYPLTKRQRANSIGLPGEKQIHARSLKDGGNQIEYEDQDPRIHKLWLEEMQKHKITPKLIL